MIKLFKVKEKQRELAENSNGKPPVKSKVRASCVSTKVTVVHINLALKSGRSSPITGVPVMTSTIKRYPDSGITNAVFSSGDNEEQKDKKEALFYTLICKNKLPGPNKSTTMATETKVLKIKSTLVVSDEKEAGIKNVVADSGDSSGSEEQKNETDTVTGLTISMDRVNIGSQKKKKKKLLVIPLRGIFVHRAHRWWPATIPRNRQPDFCYGNFLVYMRPYCVGFLKFCFERFNVGLWSSTREQNLQGILDYVMGDLKNKLLFTWDQEHCTDSGFVCLENQDKPLFLKELSHIWEKKYPNLPWSDGEYSASNTLLITYPEKALLNPVTSSEVSPRATKKQQLCVLLMGKTDNIECQTQQSFLRVMILNARRMIF